MRLGGVSIRTSIFRHLELHRIKIPKAVQEASRFITLAGCTSEGPHQLLGENKFFRPDKYTKGIFS
jgi:hypothetical protein